MVDNRAGAGAGAGGTVGCGVVARAAPDGYTILMGSVATHAIAPGRYCKLACDALNDFAPVMQVSSSLLRVASSAKHNVSTLTELIAAVQAQPGKLNCGSTSASTSTSTGTTATKAMARYPSVPTVPLDRPRKPRGS